MRRLLLLLVAVGFMGPLAGCKLMHSHGVCDCEEDDHCAERAPWLRQGVPTNGSEVIATPPAKLPMGTKKGL